MSVRVPAVPRRLATSAVAVRLAWVALAGSAAAEPIQTGPTSIATAGPLKLTVAATDAELPIGRWQVVAMTPPRALGVSRLSVTMQLESDGLRATARWLWKPQTQTIPTPQRSPRP